MTKNTPIDNIVMDIELNIPSATWFKYTAAALRINGREDFAKLIEQAKKILHDELVNVYFPY